MRAAASLGLDSYGNIFFIGASPVMCVWRGAGGRRGYAELHYEDTTQAQMAPLAVFNFQEHGR